MRVTPRQALLAHLHEHHQLEERRRSPEARQRGMYRLPARSAVRVTVLPTLRDSRHEGPCDSTCVRHGHARSPGDRYLGVGCRQHSYGEGGAACEICGEVTVIPPKRRSPAAEVVRPSRERRRREHLVRLLLERDGDRCHYCGASFTEENPPTTDHVVPLAADGKRRDPANLVLACRPCNQEKADRPASWFREWRGR